MSTEYRLQFVWPHVRKAIKGDSNNAQDTPRKSLSMGAIKSSQTNAMPTVHKKRTANEKEGATGNVAKFKQFTFFLWFFSKKFKTLYRGMKLVESEKVLDIMFFCFNIMNLISCRFDIFDEVE